MKFKITLAAFACSGTLLAIPPTSASAAPVSGMGQARSAALENPLLQKVHRRWRRGWGPLTGMGPGMGMGMGMGPGMATGTGTLIIGPPILPIEPMHTAATTLRHRLRLPTIITGRIGGLITSRGHSG